MARAVPRAYRALIGTVAAIRPDATVLVHDYDCAIPDGRTLPGLRSWLKLPMDNVSVPTAGADPSWRSSGRPGRSPIASA